MMNTDTYASASEAAARVVDPRLTAFHDPGRLLGRAMAARLGWRYHVAWDTYFIYRPGIRWTEDLLPAPDAWYHQLKDREAWDAIAREEVGSSEWTQALAEKSEADPARFATGTALRDALELALDDVRAVRVHV
jgi:hypothetical protein